jgi:hypothetical protein
MIQGDLGGIEKGRGEGETSGVLPKVTQRGRFSTVKRFKLL